jgi:hypothetical protein
MTGTDGADFESSRRDRIRLLIGATGENQMLINDKELDFCMKEQKFDEFAAAMACDTLARKCYDKPDMAKRYRQLAESLRNEGVRRYAKPYFGGTR